ncbi:uncharacterized protein si:ch211-277c7.7 [Rhinichthys klamathensis goyatoka]|uniref:uncharacterized protein si:ch211-277c7.7 n=1 Tax=Rhinichthys klamathensis goyatoka TaxID=3034132 RepID=UPI0024B61202|nr:uncharacterized protein si:ch211-277c7.7 [Rhinichthys klamathensis goyatoka]
MATYCKLLYTPSFSSQSPQIFKKPGFTGENSKHHKLSRNWNRLTQEATPSPLLHFKSPEITPCFSRKMKTNHLLRFYSNIRTYQKSTVNLRAPEGGKSQRAKRDARGGPSSDTFGFPPRDPQAAAEEIVGLSQTKQDVLSTIKKMLEENRVIRERLLTLRQLSRSE